MGIPTMDRPLSKEFLDKQTQKKWIRVAAPILILIPLLIWIASSLSPAVERIKLRVAAVEIGEVEATLTASGTVVPEFEQVITSPIETRVLKVLKRPGDTILAQESILILDNGAALASFEKHQDQVSLKVNAIEQSKAELSGSVTKLKAQVKVKELEVETNRVKFEQSKQLFSKGIISKNDLDQAELAFERSKAELESLVIDKQNAELSTRLKIDGLNLELRMLQKDKQEARKELDRATPKPDRNGVLTWTLATEGATVHKGDMVAKVADLSTYRVDATISDIHASRLAIGQAVQLKLGETRLDGALSNILPTIENGAIKLTVQLADKANKLLRSNLRVDVFIVTGRETRNLRVRKPQLVDVEGKTHLFVIRGSRAVRMPVSIGLIGFEFVEIKSGLNEGDEVILSDMSDYKHLKEVRLKE